MPQVFKSLPAVLVLACLPAAAAAQENGRAVEASYYVHARGIRAGEFTFRFTANGESYTASADRRITGALRALAGASQDYQYSVEGAVEDDRLTPARYRHSGGRRGRVVHVEFTPDDIVTTADPPMGMGDPPATQDQRRGAIDQLSAIATMMIAEGEVCDRTLRVYLDGRSRFDFVMRPDGMVDINSRAYRGPAHRCLVDYRPIAGFSEPQEPAVLTFLFAATSSGMYAPVSIEMPTDDVGIIRLEARKLFLNGERLR